MCIGKERDVEADKRQPETPLPESLARHPAAELRQPVVHAGQHRKDRAADQHVMEMSDQKIGVMHLPVERHDGHHHAGQSAQHEDEHEAEDEQQRRQQARPLAPQAADPGEDLHAAGDGDHQARAGEEIQRQFRQARRVHVMHPQAKAQKAGQQNGDDDPRVADDPPRKRADDHRHDAGRRQKNDVHLGMAEEPEQMLPQQMVAALLIVEESRAEIVIQFEQQRRHEQRREREHDHHGRRQPGPGVQRHLVERHARRAQAEDRDRQLRTGGDAGHFRRAEPDDPEVDSLAGEGRRRERRVGKPADVGDRVEQEAGEENQAAEQKHPVAERGQPRIGQIARAEHPRQQQRRQSFLKRHGEQIHHDRAVHREQAVVDFRAEKVVVGARQLNPHQEGEHAGDQKERKARHQKPHADQKVVDGRQLAGKAASARPTFA